MGDTGDMSPTTSPNCALAEGSGELWLDGCVGSCVCVVCGGGMVRRHTGLVPRLHSTHARSPTSPLKCGQKERDGAVSQHQGGVG